MKGKPIYKESMILFPKLQNKIDAMFRHGVSDDILKMHLERMKNNWPSNMQNGDLFYADAEGIFDVLSDENYIKTYTNKHGEKEAKLVQELVAELSIFMQYVAKEENMKNQEDLNVVARHLKEGSSPERLDKEEHPTSLTSDDSMPDVKKRLRDEIYAPINKERIPNK